MNLSKSLFLLIFFSVITSSAFSQQIEAPSSINETISKDTSGIEEDQELVIAVEEMPRFPGCDGIEDKQIRKECSQRKMLEFIYQNIQYPELARKKEIEGMVVIRFIVEKDGQISNATIVREIGGGCGEESLRVVNSMPAFIPGKQKGKPVRVYFNLPINFKLEKQSKSKRK